MDIFGNKLSEMEFKRLVYNAAREGKLYRLKVLLDHKPKKSVKMYVSAYTSGATPLVMACRNGHLDVVIYLIEKCHAGIEQGGSVISNGETIEGASPLWCAASAGHLNIVKTLVKHNAAVNSTTKSNSTPLRAACFDGHLEIAQYLIQHGADIETANEHGHTNLMISCYKGHYEIAKYLLDCGADMNRKSAKGNTALHNCAESGSLEILKMLLNRGAKIDTDTSGVTPLLSAAINGHAPIVDYFIKERECNNREKVNALDLLGATYIDKKSDMLTALAFWRQAMYLKYEDRAYPLGKPYERSPIASYVHVTEVRTFSQLDELMADPDEMQMQALLVRERILGPGHSDTIYYIRYRGAMYADNGNFEKCIQLWMYALDMQQQVKEPLSPMTLKSLLAFTELFSYMMTKAGEDQLNEFPAVTFGDVLRVFRRSVTEIERALRVSQHQEQDLIRSNRFHRTVIIALYLIGLCRLQPNLNQNEEMTLRRAVFYFVHLNPKAKNGSTLLHLASFKDSPAGRFPVVTFPSPEVVELLLEVGACVNALDLSNNTPLHVAAAAMNIPCARTIFKALLDHGAHLDVHNSENKTPLQLASATALVDINPLRYINLQCLCAQTINAYKIPYKGLVHGELCEFLDSHASH